MFMPGGIARAHDFSSAMKQRDRAARRGFFKLPDDVCDSCAREKVPLAALRAGS
jgi:hypothetical protein